MNNVNMQLNQETLDSLREIRKTLYKISNDDIAAMSLDDQIIYGRNLQDVGVAIWNLEAAKLKEVNDQFKSNEQALHDSTLNLESSLVEIKSAVQVIRTVSKILQIITGVIVLLA